MTDNIEIIHKEIDFIQSYGNRTNKTKNMRVIKRNGQEF